MAPTGLFSLEASARVTGFCISGLTGHEVSQTSISQLQSGSASVEVPAHGIVLHRVNVTSISLSDKHADAAENLVRTEGKVKADIYEMTAMATAIAKMMNEMGCTFQEATEFVQIERGKISKEIRQSNLNVSGDDLELLRRLTNAQLPRRLP